MAARALDVWMNGEPVGVWYASRDGTPLFQYRAEWLQSPRRRPLSLSLPFVPGNAPHRGTRVDAWFDNLLPDSAAIRQRLGRRFRARSTHAFDLLEAVGRDCVGAVQLLPAGGDPGDVRRIAAEPLGDADVARMLRGVTSAEPPGGAGAGGTESDDLRISIAGAQEKMALVRIDGRWLKPHGATPTTHLLKLPLGLIGNMRANMRDSVENEWLCMQFLQRLGLPAAHTEIATFRDAVSEEKVLVVERFDRTFVAATADDPAWIVRLPQEDFCQATGTPGDRKYESDGGPGIRRCLSLLAAGGRAADDALVFAKAQLAFWLLAAPDGHAKNFSLFLRRDGYAMTPLYDVLSAWPIVGPGPNEWSIHEVKLAMALRGKSPHRKLGEIAVRHWRALAVQTGVPDAFAQMTAMVDGADASLRALESSLPREFPTVVWDRMAQGVRGQRDKFLFGVALGAGEG